MKSNYPVVSFFDKNIDSLSDWAQEVTRIRADDVTAWRELPLQYVTGRRTERIPSANNDVVAGDREGDIVYAANASHVYILVDKSGTLTWARIALDTTW